MKIPSIKSNKLALIYGILLGDGCLSKVGSKHYFISVAGSIIEDLPFFQEVVVPLLKEFVSNNIKIQKRIKQKELHICFTNRKLFEFLVKIGFPIGKKGTKVKIPDHFSKKCLKNIVKGYFENRVLNYYKGYASKQNLKTMKAKFGDFLGIRNKK